MQILRGLLRWSLCCVSAFFSLGLSMSSSSAEALRLRLDFLPAAYHAPLFYGIAKDIYKSSGIDLAIADGKGTNVALQAVAGRTEEIALANYGALLQAAGKGMPVVAIGGLVQRLPDSLFALRSTPVLKPKDLEGKSLGLQPASAVFKLFPAFAAAADIDPAKVKIVQLDASTTLTALLNGQIDVANGWAFTDAVKVAAQRPINPPLIMADFGVNILGVGFVVHKQTLATKKETLRRFMAATARSYAESLRNPESAVEALIAARPGLDRAVMLEQIRLMPEFLYTVNSRGRPFGWTSIEDWKQTYDLSKRYFGMTENLAIDTAFTNELVSQE